MTNDLSMEAEERFGIKADTDHIKNLQTYLYDTYGGKDRGILDKVFSSGEAAGFLTVNETYFFREPAHFSFLLDALPSFENMGIRILCAAAASGCEAYSAAMLIEAYNRGAVTPVSYQIDAFDINPKVIETACRGVYGSRALREDGSCFRYMADPYLTKTENGYQADPLLKKNIRFFVHNLMDEIPPKEYDFVFFRNAFIYFSPRNRGLVIANLSKVLREGGILLLGVSETAGAHNACSEAGLDQESRKDVFYFQKKGRLQNSGQPVFTEMKLRNKIELAGS
jgi:chemotaxis protein methyltransferase CheR